MVQQVVPDMEQRLESLGPAERILNHMLEYVDHLFHNRIGMVVEDARTRIGVRWHHVSYEEKDGQKEVIRLDKVGKKTTRTPVGIWGEDDLIRKDGVVVGRYQPAGIFKEVAVYIYRNIAEIWAMDQDFVARWASYVFSQDHRDMKVIVAAFMLVQSDRRGDPIRSEETGEILFYDEDYRDIGEAMCLIRRRGSDLGPREIERMFDVLRLPAIAAINRELGFTSSPTRKAKGRLPSVVRRWLGFRERNRPLLDGIVRASMKRTVWRLCQYSNYKPAGEEFFQVLGYKQKQRDDGRRKIALDIEMPQAESWEGLSESDICQKISDERLSLKYVVGKLPSSVGMTPAVVAASMMHGGMSAKEILIASPTLEALGLLDVPEIKAKHAEALAQVAKRAEDQRAANIAMRMRKKENVQALEQVSEAVVAKKVEKSLEDFMLYLVIDRSISMRGSLERGKQMLLQMLPGILQVGMDKIKVSTFNTDGKEIRFRHASAEGVEHAFRSEKASGGTAYAEGVRVLNGYPPKDHEESIIFFVGDQEDRNTDGLVRAINLSGLRPAAFGLIEVLSPTQMRDTRRPRIVEATAARLGIPCFMIEEDTFSDPYALPRTLQRLIESTPVTEQVTASRASVGRGRRKSLIEKILETDLLRKPGWAMG